MAQESVTAGRIYCPACGAPGKPVGTTTMRALLKEEDCGRMFAATRQPGVERSRGSGPLAARKNEFHFCGSRSCDVVYFDADETTTFTTDHLRVPVGIKQRSGDRPLCYCFGYSVASIKEGIRTKGTSNSWEEIRRMIQDRGCRCETRNPSGSCCLREVAVGVRTAYEELKMTEFQHTTAKQCSGASKRKPEKIATVGALASAIVASSCCWLTPALFSIGASGTGLALMLDSHHTALQALSIGFLAVAFYFVCRHRKGDDDQDCCDPAEPEGRQDSVAQAGRKQPDRFQNVLLWAATGAVAVVVLVPRELRTLSGFFEGSACCAVPPLEADAQSGVPAAGQSRLADSPAGSELKTTGSKTAPAHREAATLTVLSDDVHELKAAFNEDKTATKVLMIVSPRCPMCRYGARVVQEKAFAQIDSAKLKIYVVWIKRFFGDSRDAAKQAMELVPDKRARHFWDGSGSLGKQYGKVLDLPGGQSFAWDVYLVFDPKTQWTDAPPAPSFWMHQLGGQESRSRLDGERFRAAIRKRLPK